MTPYQARLTPTVKRMAEDMRIRNFAQATIDAYTYHVDKFEKHFNKSVTDLGPEEIHQYQLHLVDVKKVSWSQFNQAVCGLRFLYESTLGKPWTIRHIPFGELREYWKVARSTSYLLSGKTLEVPLSSATIQKACKVAALQDRINLPHISPHTLRHSYATGMLEAGVDLLTISKLLGHSSFVTTMIYLHCRRPHLERAPSPIDWLDKTAKLLLPKVNYFQVVFTLPDTLSPVILGNRRQMYKLLFQLPGKPSTNR